MNNSNHNMGQSSQDGNGERNSAKSNGPVQINDRNSPSKGWMRCFARGVMVPGHLIAIACLVVLNAVIWWVASLSLDYFSVKDGLEAYLIDVGIAVNIALVAVVLLAIRPLGKRGSGGEKPSNASDTICGLSDDFGARARKLRQAAWAYLCLTFVLFPVSIWAFIEADELTKEDSDTVAEIVQTHFPSPPDYTDVAVCGKNVVIVGEEGRIRTSSDSGSRWKGQVVDRDFNSVAYSNDCAVAIVVGDRGTVMFSIDQGRNWNPTETPIAGNFYQVVLSEDGKTAIAVGSRGLIRYSIDSGATWTDPGAIANTPLYAVDLSYDGNTAVAVGRDGSVVTAKHPFGEDNWQYTVVSTRQESGDRPKSFEDVALEGSEEDVIAVAVGRDGLIRTSDSSFTWISHDIDTRDDFKAVALSGSGDFAMVVGRRGSIRIGNNSQPDGNWNWREGKSDVGQDLEAIALSNDGKIAVAVGDDGVILVSTDSGDSWMKVTDPPIASHLKAIDMAATEQGYSAFIVGEEGISLRLQLADGQAPKLEIITGGVTTDPISLVAIEDAKSEIRKNTWWQIYLLRVGIVTILMVMVRYLISLTRYNFRLAAFYDARRDTLVLLPHGEVLSGKIRTKKLERTMQAFSPDDIDSQRPDTPSWIKQMLLRMFDTAKPERPGTNKS